MIRILIPFSDPDRGERAVCRLVEENPSPSVEVELLAVVEARTPGKVRLYLSPKHAEALASEAAARWLKRLESLLDLARISHRSRIAVGPPRRVIAREMQRRDIDRVLISIPARRGLGRVLASRRAGQVRRATSHPVTVVP